MTASELPNDPNWRPDAAQLSRWSAKKVLWRAHKSKPFEDAAGRTYSSPNDFAVQCGSATWEWDASGTWRLVKNECTGNCDPMAPTPTGDAMHVGLQVTIPCQPPASS